MENVLSEQEKAEMMRLKAYFPYRIVYGVRNEDGTFEASAVTTMRIPNKLTREGKQVFILKAA